MDFVTDTDKIIGLCYVKVVRLWDSYPQVLPIIYLSLPEKAKETDSIMSAENVFQASNYIKTHLGPNVKIKIRS